MTAGARTICAESQALLKPLARIRMRVAARQLHALEQPRIAAADFELLVVPAHGHDLAAAEVAAHAGDGLDVDQRAAVDLPELLRVELVHQLLDGLSDQRFNLRCLHARVLFVADESEDLVDQSGRGGRRSERRAKRNAQSSRTPSFGGIDDIGREDESRRAFKLHASGGSVS